MTLDEKMREYHRLANDLTTASKLEHRHTYSEARGALNDFVLAAIRSHVSAPAEPVLYALEVEPGKLFRDAYDNLRVYDKLPEAKRAIKGDFNLRAIYPAVRPFALYTAPVSGGAGVPEDTARLRSALHECRAALLNSPVFGKTAKSAVEAADNALGITAAIDAARTGTAAQPSEVQNDS